MLPEPTERLRFREWRDEDTELVLRQFSDPQARRFFSDFDNLENAGKWIDFMRKRQAEHGHSLWVLERLEDGRAIGDCGLLRQEVEGQPVVEVGYHLAAEARGQGHATEAARACLALAFRELDVDEVASLVHPENEPSARVAARVHQGVRDVRWRDEPYALWFTRRPT